MVRLGCRWSYRCGLEQLARRHSDCHSRLSATVRPRRREARVQVLGTTGTVRCCARAEADRAHEAGSQDFCPGSAAEKQAAALTQCPYPAATFYHVPG